MKRRRRVPRVNVDRRARRRAESATSAFKAFVASLPCRVGVEIGAHVQCRGPVEVAHVGRRGMSQKSKGRTLIPLCGFCHRTDSHDHATVEGKLGYLASMSKWDRQDWYDAQIEAVNKLYDARERAREQGGIIPW